MSASQCCRTPLVRIESPPRTVCQGGAGETVADVAAAVAVDGDDAPPFQAAAEVVVNGDAEAPRSTTVPRRH